MLKTAMIMAAGKGERLYPLTKDLPKPLLKLGDKPIIEYNLSLLKKHNIKNVFINACYLSDKMEEYFAKRENDGLNIHLNIEPEILGTAGGVKNLSSKFSETFVVVSGDLLTTINIEDMYKFHKEKNSHFTIGLTEVEDPSHFGIVITDNNGKIIRFKEKPKNKEEVFSNIINTGVYIIEPYILDFIPENTFFDFSKNLFPILLKKNIPFYGYLFKGLWRDLGTISELEKAEKELNN